MSLSICTVAMQTMLSESYAVRLLQEASEARRQNMVSEACKRYKQMLSSDYYTVGFFLLGYLSLIFFFFSMETLDRKFEQVLALQQLDKSKAISQILQEVKGCSSVTQTGVLHQDQISFWQMLLHFTINETMNANLVCLACRRRCRRQPLRPCSSKGTVCMAIFAIR